MADLFCVALSAYALFLLATDAGALGLDAALITLGEFDQSGGALTVRAGSCALRVQIDTGGLEYEVVAERIEEDAPVKPTRIGMRLAQPVTRTMVRLTITPAD